VLLPYRRAASQIASANLPDGRCVDVFDENVPSGFNILMESFINVRRVSWFEGMEGKLTSGPPRFSNATKWTCGISRYWMTIAANTSSAPRCVRIIDAMDVMRSRWLRRPLKVRDKRILD
jgi:hypothetical protein